MSRACMSTRWHEQNVQFQCKRCNGFRSGEQYLYSIRLDQDHGEGTAEKLLRTSKQTRKFSRDELESMYHHYKRLVNELRSTKGL
jgi:ribosome-binding protein aMBF1 (putative translation factor)